MRKIYLIRHCEPDFSKIRKDYETAGTICLGTGDPPLSFTGRLRAVLVGEWIRSKQVTAVFCSTKNRSRETALAIASNAQTVRDLHEIGMGIWEGMSMDEIRARYPDVYEARGKTPYSVYPEGGEAPADALVHFSQADVRAHSRAVAARCDEITDDLMAKGVTLDKALIHASAMLHDILRTEDDHAAKAASMLRTLGYPDAADIIAAHHDLPEAAMREPCEQAVLYLADKQTDGTKQVSVGMRFAASLAKCDTEEARLQHAKRYEQTRRVERLLS